jgi:hypothetical protein
MTRNSMTCATLLASLCVAGTLRAQAPAQPYPQQQPYPGQPGAYPAQPAPQQYPPSQTYPQQGYPQQGYPQQQPYPAQPYQPAAQPYGPSPYAAPQTAAFGVAGQFILSADRLFGLSFWSWKTDRDNGVTATLSGTSINLLSGSDMNIDRDGFAIPSPYSTARLGFDYVVASNITLGGSLGFVSRSGTDEVDNNGETNSNDLPSIIEFIVNPRFGYALVINPTVALWFRGGITYFSEHAELKETRGTATFTSSLSLNGFALSLDPQLVITPVPHFGLTLGPVADIPLSGTTKTEVSGAATGSQEHTSKITNFGLTFGLLGYI